MINPLVYVVILNYNHIDDLKETIESFNLQNYSNFRIIVSDNGSDDESVMWLKKTQREIVVIKNNANLGWAEGNNVGIRYALEHGAKYVLLANNDLSFNSEDVIALLMQSFEKISNLGIIGPSENSYYFPEKLVNQGWIIFPKENESFNINRSSFEKNKIPQRYRIVDNVSGSFMIIKRDVFEDVGEIDKRLFLYAEDADFSLRAWKKGWISLVDTDVTILHKISATSGNNSPLKIYYKTRNLIYLIRKHKDQQSSHAFFIRKYYFDFLKQTIKIIYRPEYSNNRFLTFKANIIGFVHGAITKKMNKYY